MLKTILPKRRKQNVDYITNLPNDCFVVIVSFLDIYSLMQLSLTCKIIHNHLSNQYMWACKFQEVNLFKKAVIEKYLKQCDLRNFNSENLSMLSSRSRERIILENPKLEKYAKLLQKTCIKYAKMGFKGFWFSCKHFIKCSSKMSYYVCFGVMDKISKDFIEKNDINKNEIFMVNGNETVKLTRLARRIRKFLSKNNFNWLRKYILDKNFGYCYEEEKEEKPKQKVKQVEGSEVYMKQVYAIEFLFCWK